MGGYSRLHLGKWAQCEVERSLLNIIKGAYFTVHECITSLLLK